MEDEQMPSSETAASGKLAGLGERLKAKTAEEAKVKPAGGELSPRQGTSDSAKRQPKPRNRDLEVVGGRGRRNGKGAPSPAETIASPKQATVKMDERMRMAWALLRATSGKTLQDLQYEAFNEYLRKRRAYEMVDLHTGDLADTAEG